MPADVEHTRFRLRMLGLPGPRPYRTDDNPNGDFEDAVGHARHNGHSYYLREVRHEALHDRVEVRDHHLLAVAAAR